MNRRTFLHALGATAGGLALAGASRSDGSAQGRPSLLFAIADDWSWPHAGCGGDKAVKTPTFDLLAKDGVLFTRTYCCAPSCTPSRGGILTGQTPHRLEEGGNLWSRLDKKFECYPDLLEAAGYVVGCERKGWGPGAIEGTGRTRNPAGPAFRNFAEFLKTVPKDKPFCYWFGSTEPHRPYRLNSGRESGMDINAVKVPPFLPDNETVRSDILDYYFEVQCFDSDVRSLLKDLDAAGRAENTLVVMTSDNGMPFPRAKASLYDCGTHMPMAARWPARAKGGRTVDEFISFADFAPTFLDAAGLKPLPAMTGRSFLDLLTGEKATDPRRDKVFVERERHASCREGNVGYPCRAIRTKDFLYIRNLKPDRWPAGDPEHFGDVDGSPTKTFILENRDVEDVAPFFRYAFAKRPAEELYDLKKDPAELINFAQTPEYAEAKKTLNAALDQWMIDTADPRAQDGEAKFDQYEYIRPPKREKGQAGRK